MRALVIPVFVLACGAKPPPGSWVEREGLGTSTRDPEPITEGSPAPTGVDISKLDVTKLDQTKIDQLDELTCRAVLDKLGTAAPAGRVALRAARLAWHRGDPNVARWVLSRAASAADQAAVAADATALTAQMTTPGVAVKTIAVLLPLTGKYAAIGHELKIAVQLASAGGGSSGTAWHFLDTKGDPEGAVAAVEQAVAKGAIAILGPVGEREAIAAARRAALHGIPIGLLAPADGADVASGVFRLVGSPADEGRAVAQLAHDEGFPTVGVFAPRDDVGGESAAAFILEAKRLGLQVTGEGAYDPTGGNLEPEIKDFLGMVPAKNPRFAAHLRRNGKKGWLNFTPDITFSLLYIPDRYDRAALVAAFLPYYGVELRTTEFPDPDRLKRKHGGVMPQVVQLLGGAGWHHSSLPIRGGPAVQGAMIVDSFPGELGGDIGLAFSAAFQQRTNRQPSAAAAETYDAATLVAKIRQTVASSADPRAAFRAALSRGTLDDGACGPASIGADGELVREPAVLEVVGDQLQLMP
ncbi:MAG: penicillin-binding protein activator [Deltaproteobacteria bacterium]|nr:penicillin-binding protein activator [Deltaproteobacteria bacterium]